MTRANNSGGYIVARHASYTIPSIEVSGTFIPLRNVVSIKNIAVEMNIHDRHEILVTPTSNFLLEPYNDYQKIAKESQSSQRIVPQHLLGKVPCTLTALLSRIKQILPSDSPQFLTSWDLEKKFSFKNQKIPLSPPDLQFAFQENSFENQKIPLSPPSLQFAFQENSFFSERFPLSLSIRNNSLH